MISRVLLAFCSRCFQLTFLTSASPRVLWSTCFGKEDIWRIAASARLLWKCFQRCFALLSLCDQPDHIYLQTGVCRLYLSPSTETWFWDVLSSKCKHTCRRHQAHFAGLVGGCKPQTAEVADFHRLLHPLSGRGVGRWGQQARIPFQQ